MKKLTIGVFFGSRSAEHDVSIVTAIAAIIKPLKVAGYTVVPVYISKDGKWYSDLKLADIKTFSSGDIDALLQKLKPVALVIGDGLQIVQSGIGGKKTPIDVAFPATHGTHGEDGELMSIFELAVIPYVGCNPEASVIAMDKVLAKQVVEAAGLATPKYVWCSSREFLEDQKAVVQRASKLRYPLFVKPAHLGSSIGISKVDNETQLLNAIEVAVHYDDKVVIEEAVQNLIEVTLPIIGNDELILALLEEPIAKADGVFDFETKYMNQGKGGKKMGGATSGSQGYSKLPAELPGTLSESARELATAVYRTVGCSGIARIDMLIDSKQKKVYFNEINPLPGSLYAHNWRAAGISNVELVEKLVAFAVERHETQQKHSTVFSTNFLKQF